MADQTSHDLRYGHVGPLIYNKPDSEWLSRRAFVAPLSLTPVTSSHYAVKPAGYVLEEAHHDAESQLSEHGSNCSASTKSMRATFAHLIREAPALTSTTDLTVPLARLSHHVSALTHAHDPTVGDLLALGRVSDRNRKRPLQVAAFPAGPSATSVCIMQVQFQKLGWDHNKSIWIDVPRLGGDTGAWHVKHPIRQLCFFSPNDDAQPVTPFLAVRTNVAIHILNLSLRTAATSWDHLHGQPSRLRIIPAYTLDLHVLGGVSPAHVSFNPYYDKQFATIDQHGTWRIWDMSYQAMGHHGIPLEVCVGATHAHSVAIVPAEGTVLDDGWGRVLWSGSSSTLITASRRALAIYDVEGKPIRRSLPDLGIDRTPHWILDLQASPSPHPIVFVLTSTNLTCLHVRPLSLTDSENLEMDGARVLFTTRHFRDSEDISLRLATFLDGEDIVIMLKSSLSLVATVYRGTFDETSSGPFLSISDPTMIMLPEDPSASGHPYHSVGIFAHTAEYGEGGLNTRGASGPGQEYRDSSIRFYMLTMLSNTLNVVEKLYAGQSKAPQHQSTVLPPAWHSRVAQSSIRLQDNNFVIDDEHVVQSTYPVALEQSQSTGQAIRAKERATPAMGRNWTVVYEHAYEQVLKHDRNNVQDFNQALDMIRAYSRSQDDQQPSALVTLHDICKGQVIVSDIDEASARFERLFHDGAVSQEHQGDMSPIGAEQRHHKSGRLGELGSSKVLGIPSSPRIGPNMMTVYDDIMNSWLMPLSPRVPGRVRLAKEQLARRVAAEVCLASCGSRIMSTPPVPEQVDQLESVEMTNSFLGSSQSRGTFPTPSPTATPSLTTATSLSSHPSTLASPEYLTLQQWTTFSPDKMAPGPLAKGLSSKLAHWSLGSDPKDYDWLHTQKKLDKEAEEEDEGLSIKERKKLKRRAEKHLEKQRKETMKASTMNMASSQAPRIIASASQPASVAKRGTPALSAMVGGAASQGNLLSSPQPMSSQATPGAASQVQPGRFGGRAKPAKKRKRTEGF